MRDRFFAAMVLGLVLAAAGRSALAQCHALEALTANPAELAKLFEEPGKAAVTAAQVGALTEIKGRLSRAARLAFVLGVCKAEVPNAAALVRGREAVIVFTTALLEVIGDDKDMAAFVMAHEMAHVVANHHARHALKERAAVAEATANAVNDERDSGVKGVAWLRARQIHDRITKGFSRELEQEADEVGMQILIDAGFDPRGAVRAGRRMRAERGNWSDELSSHAGWDQRIARLEALSEAQGQKTARVEAARSQQHANATNSEMVDRLLAARRLRQAERFVAQWLKLMPQSGTAWYYQGIVLQRSPGGQARALEAFENAVSFDPEYGDGWLAYCEALFHSGHRMESANCARNIPGSEQFEQFRERTFGASLVTGGRPPLPPSTLWMARDAAGRKVLTNSRDTLVERGMPETRVPPEWIRLR